MMAQLPLPAFSYVRMAVEGIGWAVTICALVGVLRHLPFWVTGTNRRDFIDHALRDDFDPCIKPRRDLKGVNHAG